MSNPDWAWESAIARSDNGGRGSAKGAGRVLPWAGQKRRAQVGGILRSSMLSMYGVVSLQC